MTLAVPLSAVSAEGEQSFVWVVDPENHTLQRRSVALGAYHQDQATITDGLRPGDWVVAAGVHMLREGQQVVPVDRQNRQLDLDGE